MESASPQRIENLGSNREDDLQATSDAHNAGLTVPRTGLASSVDRKKFVWEEDISSPTGEDWDA